MQYMGSKNRHAKEMLPIILKNREEGQWYVEPFCGGCNMIDKVDGNRIANDTHKSLIMLLTSVSEGWVPPDTISEEQYKEYKKSPDGTMKGFVGFLCSFGAKWFAGYARNKVGTNYAKTGRNALIKQAPNLAGIEFSCASYDDMKIPPKSIIYCDPPYAGTTKYAGGFDHGLFWKWCEQLVSDGHAVFVSEYSAPDGWECVWEKKVTTNFDSGRSKAQNRTEKLFTYRTAA